MIRVKFIKDYKQYKRGDIENVSPNEAFGLIDSGKAIVSKDMTEADTTTAMIPSVFAMPKRSLKNKIKEK